MIKLEKITKSYQGIEVLSETSVNLEDKVYALLGPNGSGKTTLMRIIVGLLKQSSGHITYGSHELKDVKIGYLPQKFGAFKDISVYNQLKYYAILKDIEDNQDEEIKNALECVHLSEEINKKCGDLSGGMLRRLGIAQALLGKPDIIIFDEPTAGLDIEEQVRFKNILQTMKHKCPIIISTHIVEDVRTTCELYIVLKKGKTIFEGNKQAMMEIVKGHVYKISKDKLESIESSYYLVNNDEGQSDDECRILCNIKNNDMVEETPNLQDAYLYLIKGMNNEKG